MNRSSRFVTAILCAACAFVPVALARTTADGSPVVALSSLPKEARTTHALILRGGPFRYDRDGAVFGNRERLLPAKPRGYYHEYTVTSPGVRNRGAQRIICGGAQTQPDACYFTNDHYQSFKRIRE